MNQVSCLLESNYKGMLHAALMRYLPLNECLEIPDLQMMQHCQPSAEWISTSIGVAAVTFA